jgi:hypothetical protein
MQCQAHCQHLSLQAHNALPPLLPLPPPTPLSWTWLSVASALVLTAPLT